MTMRRKPAFGAVAFALSLVLAGATAPASQSDSDARRENQKLATQVADLQRELDAARKSIAAMEAEIVRLKTALAAAQRAVPASTVPGTTGPAAPAPTAPPQVTIDESIPDASPNALFRALEASYQEAVHDQPIGEPQDKVRVAYLRSLDRWVRRVNRDFRSQIQWHVRVAQLPGPETGGAVRLQAVDPVTDVPLGDPIDVMPPKAQLQRLATLARRGELGVLILKGVLMPNVMLNPSRADKGPFDKPRLIGPFAEFDPRLEVSSLTEPEPEPKQEPPAPR